MVYLDIILALLYRTPSLKAGSKYPVCLCLLAKKAIVKKLPKE